MTHKTPSHSLTQRAHVLIAAAALRQARQRETMRYSDTQVDLLGLALAHAYPRRVSTASPRQTVCYCRVCGDRIHGHEVDADEAQLCAECEAIAHRLRDPQFPWKESK